MSEPQRIGEILPGVLRAIEQRCRDNPENKDFNQTRHDYRERVLHATRGFFDKRQSRGNAVRPRPNRRKAERCLF